LRKAGAVVATVALAGLALIFGSMVCVLPRQAWRRESCIAGVA
jgi:hypothetical protein